MARVIFRLALLQLAALLGVAGTARARGGNAQANPGAKGQARPAPTLLLPIFSPQLGGNAIRQAQPGFGFSGADNSPALSAPASPFSLPKSVITGETLVFPQRLGPRSAEIPGGYRRPGQAAWNPEIVPIFAGPGQGAAGPGAGMARQSSVISAKARALAAPLELAGRLSEHGEMTADSVGDAIWAVLSGGEESGAENAEDRGISGRESRDRPGSFPAYAGFSAALEGVAVEGLSAGSGLSGRARAQAGILPGQAKAAKLEFPEGVPLIVMEVFEKSLRLSVLTTGAGALERALALSLPLKPAARLALGRAPTDLGGGTSARYRTLGRAPTDLGGGAFAPHGEAAAFGSQGELELYAFHDFLASARGRGFAAGESMRLGLKSQRGPQDGRSPGRTFSLRLLAALLFVGGWSLSRLRRLRG